MCTQAPPDGPPRPKLLVCHDHRGGYGEDRWALGGADSGTSVVWSYGSRVYWHRTLS